MTAFDGAEFDPNAFDAGETALADAAVGSGAAATPVVAVEVNAGVATGTGSAFNAVASITANTEADAQTAAGTGAAYGATVITSGISVFAGVARGIGRAYTATTTQPSTGVEVLIDGVEYQPIVHFPTFRVESLVNGQPGRGHMRIRDDDQVLSFVGGEEVVVRIGGENKWRGFVVQGKRVYIAPALNVFDAGLTRWYDLEMVDINILFTKRIVFRQSDPDNVYGTLFPEGTADTTALANLFANFLDLFGDGLDTSTLIENVADINVDQEARGWSGGYTWVQAMQSLNMLPNGIFYIDPDKNVVWTDVDTPNAPFGLSDQPNGTTTRGYREMEILKDGTNLANDVMAWGAGYGSDVPVFVRDQDATSQSEHGLWQRGVLSPGVYKQATINRIAESIIDGSPSSKRGAKNDRLSVGLATYEPGLRVAQKVDFTSEVFDFNDVIPIRKMVITFEAPDNPRYDIVLSHEIDPPWGFVDPFFLNLDLPPPPPPPPPPTNKQKRVCQTSDDCLFENWDRVLLGSLGTVSSGGQDWENEIFPNPLYGEGGVDNGITYVQKFVTVADQTASVHGELDPILLAHRDVFQAPFTVSTTIYISDPPQIGEGGPNFFFQVSSGQATANLSIEGDVFLGSPRMIMRAGSNAGVTTTTFAWPGTPAESPVRMIVTDTSVTVQAFGQEVEQTGNIGDLPGDIDTLRNMEFTIRGSTMQSAVRVEMGPIVVMSDFGVPMPWCPEPDSDAFLVLDDFNRVDPIAWGTASSGYEWGAGIDPGSAGNDATTSVTGSSGRIALYSDITPGPDPDPPVVNMEIHETTDAPWNATHWVMTTRLQGSGRGRVGMVAEESDGGNSRSWGITVDPSNAEANQIEDTNGDLHAIPGGFAQGTWYFIKWEFQAGVFDRAKVWEDGDPEPDWIYNVEPSFGTPLVAPCDFRVAYVHDGDTSFGFQTASLLVDYIEFNSSSCVDLLIGFPYFEVLETLAGSLYATLSSYMPGSLGVQVNGLEQRPGIDYEETDPTVGTFTLTFITAATDKISVIYLVAP